MGRRWLGDQAMDVQCERCKTEYEFDTQQPEVDAPCVHALFPHLGDSPCWYLQRNSQKPIPM